MTAEQNRDRQGAALAYLITWACYGVWVPGRSGAVLRTQNRFGGPLPEPDARWEKQSRDRMPREPYQLDAIRRQMVLGAVRGMCSCRGWTLLAAHVRTNHVHAVLTANQKPEHVLIAMKAYSSRALNERAIDGPDCRRWGRHGSTRYLWTRDSVHAAIHYVLREQGEPMALFELGSPR